MLTEEQKQNAYKKMEMDLSAEKERRDEQEALRIKAKEDQEKLDYHRRVNGQHNPDAVIHEGIGISSARHTEMEIAIKGKKDLSFIDPLVAESITMKLKNGPEWSTRLEFLPDHSASLANNIRGAFRTIFGEIGSSNNMAIAKDYMTAWPVQFNMYVVATRLRNEGKSDEEIKTAVVGLYKL